MPHPSTLGLTLPDYVLRLRYPPSIRLVLAEIVSLHAATAGRCDCSDAHLARRLSISPDTASTAVQRLYADGLIDKIVTKSAGFTRLLIPRIEEIKAAAATNPYPESSGRYRQKPARAATGKSLVAYPESPGTPTRENPLPLPGKPRTNIPENTTLSIQEKDAHILLTDEEAKSTASPPSRRANSLSVEIKALAQSIADLWCISESHPVAWNKVLDFTSYLAREGKLEELEKQFGGYQLHRHRAGIGPHNLDNYLGKADLEYADGKWNARDWAAAAAQLTVRQGSARAQGQVPTDTGFSIAARIKAQQTTIHL